MDIEEIKVKDEKTLIKTCLIFIISIIIIFVVARYISNDKFRSSINRNVFKSETSEELLTSIDVDNDSNINIYAYDKYIVVFSKNILSQYLANGSLDSKTEITISVPIMDSKGEYFVIAEKNGHKIALLSGKNVLWERDIEGDISRVSVNNKGYVSVIIKNTAYKSKVIVFDDKGNDLFTVFLQSNYAICSDISDNNKYLAIGEVTYSGTMLKSMVMIYSTEKAQTDPENAIINTYNATEGSLIVDINYHGNDNAICRFNTYIEKVKKDSNSTIYENTDTDIFIDSNLEKSIAVVNRSDNEIFNYEYQLDFIDVVGKGERLYILNQDVPNFMIANKKLVAVNLGREVDFISSSGYLKKRYFSNNTVNSVVLGDSIAGIVYKNKIVIVKL